eukprot:scaffold108039_cov76-Phaeocystis_antarctica.AAC.2
MTACSSTASTTDAILRGLEGVPVVRVRLRLGLGLRLRPRLGLRLRLGRGRARRGRPLSRGRRQAGPRALRPLQARPRPNKRDIRVFEEYTVTSGCRPSSSSSASSRASRTSAPGSWSRQHSY